MRRNLLINLNTQKLQVKTAFIKLSKLTPERFTANKTIEERLVVFNFQIRAFVFIDKSCCRICIQIVYYGYSILSIISSCVLEFRCDT